MWVLLHANYGMLSWFLSGIREIVTPARDADMPREQK